MSSYCPATRWKKRGVNKNADIFIRVSFSYYCVLKAVSLMSSRECCIECFVGGFFFTCFLWSRRKRPRDWGFFSPRREGGTWLQRNRWGAASAAQSWTDKRRMDRHDWKCYSTPWWTNWVTLWVFLNNHRHLYLDWLAKYQYICHYVQSSGILGFKLYKSELFKIQSESDSASALSFTVYHDSGADGWHARAHWFLCIELQ